MRRLPLVLAAAAAFVPAAHAGTAVPTLTATVGPGYTISLRQNGHAVHSLPAGSYRLVVADRSPIHNFVLEQKHGGGFERAVTTPRFTGTKSITLALRKGEWEFYCAPHESVMHGDFTVT